MIRYERSILEYGPTEADATAALQAAIDAGPGRVTLPAGRTYTLTDTIRLRDGVVVAGASDAQTGGTLLTWATDDGRPMFDSDPTTHLSFAGVENVHIVTPLAPDLTGEGDCFQLTAVVNNCRFHNVTVRNFRGNAWTIGAIAGSDDHTAVGNALFSQCFVCSCGGYAFRVDGNAIAAWQMIDVNSCSGGAFHFLNGVGNHCAPVISGLWWEGGREWTSKRPILLENMSGAPVTFTGVSAMGPLDGEAFITITGANAARPVLVGASGFTWAAWVDDQTGGGQSLGGGPVCTRLPETSVAQLTVSHATPLINLANDAYLFRQTIAGDAWVLQRRVESGPQNIITATPNQVTVAGALKAARFEPTVKPTITGVYEGDTLDSVIAALVALGLVTDARGAA